MLTSFMSSALSVGFCFLGLALADLYAYGLVTWGFAMLAMLPADVDPTDATSLMMSLIFMVCPCCIYVVFVIICGLWV